MSKNWIDNVYTNFTCAWNVISTPAAIGWLDDVIIIVGWLVAIIGWLVAIIGWLVVIIGWWQSLVGRWQLWVGSLTP